jgi:acetyltransferase-like isoleucine patch superfamily enzyme
MTGPPTPSLRAAADTPWKALNEVGRLLLAPIARLYLAVHGVAWPRGGRCYGLPLIQRHRGSRIDLGSRLELRSWFGSNPLGVRRRCLLATWRAGATISIGDDVGMSGATVCAAERVRIGHRVLIGANSVIADTDFHPLDPGARQRAPQAGRVGAVEIGDDCFIGTQVLVLKGASIGAGAVIGAGSVVTGTIPPLTVAAGNPARVIRPVGPADREPPR